MSRVHIYDFVQSSSSGVVAVVSGASVYVYLAGTTTQATIYGSESGAAVSQPLTTTASGFFEFWVDSGDYALQTQKFRLYITKTGLTTIDIDNVDCYRSSGEGSTTISGSKPALTFTGTEATGPPAFDDDGGRGVIADPWTSLPNQKFRFKEENGTFKLQYALGSDNANPVWFDAMVVSMWGKDTPFSAPHIRIKSLTDKIASLEARISMLENRWLSSL